MNGIDFFQNLKALAESAFPKRCPCCGRLYESAEVFLRETKKVRSGITGLKQGYNEDGVTVVEVYRNCVCGSTLMDFFSDRRDLSAAGLKRREKFGALMAHLESKGMRRDVAREELLKILRGEKSKIIKQFISIPTLLK